MQAGLDDVAPLLQAGLDDVASSPVLEDWFKALVLPPRHLWPKGVVLPDGLIACPWKVTLVWGTDPALPGRTYARIPSLENREDLCTKHVLNTSGRKTRLDWKENACEQFGLRHPLNDWTQEMCVSHLRTLAPRSKTVEDVEDEVVIGECTCEDEGSECSVCEAQNSVPVWRRRGVQLLLVCKAELPHV
jgi:hypothetical protein